jgi:hypothetical protein
VVAGHGADQVVFVVQGVALLITQKRIVGLFLLALVDDCLDDIVAQCDPLKARLIELRSFARLTGDQAAEILGISPSTADRHWVYARAWLRREMQGHGDGKIINKIFDAARAVSAHYGWNTPPCNGARS